MSFSITVKTGHSESRDVEGLGIIYVSNLGSCSHSHGPGSRFGNTHLKPQMHSEAIHLTSNLHMSFRDTTRFL